MPADDQDKARRRTMYRGILLAIALGAGLVSAAWLADHLMPVRGGRWLVFTDRFVGLLQLVYIVPLAIAASRRRPGSGLAKGLVLGAAITAIISVGYTPHRTYE